MFIELNEFKNKYNINDMSNDRLVRMVIEKEFPEFEEFHAEWSIEDRFIKVDFYEKEVWRKEKEESNREEFCKNILLKLLTDVSNKDTNLVNEISSKLGIPPSKFVELSVERLKLVFGSYYNALEKIRDENFMKFVTNKFNGEFSK